MRFIKVSFIFYLLLGAGLMAKEQGEIKELNRVKKQDTPKKQSESKEQNGLTYLEIKGAKIPVIFEVSKSVPIGHLELNFVGGGSIFNKSIFDANMLNDGNSTTKKTAKKPAKSEKNTVQKPIVKVATSILNYGTKELGNIGFANLLESKAVQLHSTATLSTLNMSLDFLKEYEDFALDSIHSLLKNPNLTQKALSDIHTKLKAKLLGKGADFDYQARSLLNKNIFAHTPLAYPALGNSGEEIDSVTLGDVEKYLRENLVLERLIVVIGGDLDIKTSLKKLENILANLPQGSKIDVPRYSVKTTTLKSMKKDTQQAFIYFASPLRLESMHDEGYKARVIGFILGSSGFGSRLLEEIRVKRGLAYSAYIYPNITKVSTYFAGQMQTALDKQEEAIKVTQELLKEFVKNGATQEELESAKQFILGNKPLQEETLGQRLSAKFMNFYNDLPLDYKDEFIEQVQNLDLETLNNYIKSHPEIADLTFAVVKDK